MEKKEEKKEQSSEKVTDSLKSGQTTDKSPEVKKATVKIKSLKDQWTPSGAYIKKDAVIEVGPILAETLIKSGNWS